MDKVEFITLETPEGIKEFAIIDRGNEQFTSMTKAQYEELEAQREQSGTL